MSPDRNDPVLGLRSARRASAPLPAISQDAPATPLPDHVNQNIEAIKALHRRADETLSRSQRPIETLSTLVGRPAFFYGMVLFVIGVGVHQCSGSTLCRCPLRPCAVCMVRALWGSAPC